MSQLRNFKMDRQEADPSKKPWRDWRLNLQKQKHAFPGCSSSHRTVWVWLVHFGWKGFLGRLGGFLLGFWGWFLGVFCWVCVFVFWFFFFTLSRNLRHFYKPCSYYFQFIMSKYEVNEWRKSLQINLFQRINTSMHHRKLYQKRKRCGHRRKLFKHWTSSVWESGPKILIQFINK